MEKEPKSALSRRNFLRLSAGAAALGSLSIAESGCNIKFTFGDWPTETPTQTPFTPTETPIPTPTETPPPAGGPTPTPERPEISADLLGLRDRLDTEIKNYKERISPKSQISLSICDLSTKEQIDIGGERKQLAGCVANLFCGLTAIAEISQGKASYRLEDIEGIMKTMVRNSNPVEGNRLVKIIGNSSIQEGVAKINSYMKSWGMAESYYDHPPAYDTEYSLIGDYNWLVPNEINSVLEKIGSNKLFGNDWNKYVISVMYPNKLGLNFMLPWEIPSEEAYVAHKVGWVPGCPHTINDVGLVIKNDSTPIYAISLMYQNFDSCLSEDSLFYGPGVFLGKLSGIAWQTMSKRS